MTAGTLMVRYLGDVDVVVASAAHFLFGGSVLAVVAAVVEGAPHIDWTLRFVVVLAFLGLVATAATTLAWFVETQRCALSTLTPWMFLVPVYGFIIGVVVLGERPNLLTLAGIVLVLVSMRIALEQHGIAGPGPGHLHAADNPVRRARAAANQPRYISRSTPGSSCGHGQNYAQSPHEVEAQESPPEV